MSKSKASKSPLRRINNGLSVVVVVLSLYIALSPLAPQVSFWWNTHFGKKPALVTANTPASKDTVAPPEVIPKDNTLVIPSLAMQQTVFDGATAATLNKGVWHRPQTSSPDKGGNTVFVGHRFTYSGPAVFYSLDKVKAGDKVVLYWQQKKYVYEVNKIIVVPPTAIEIEAPTTDPLLTIYTCTPLWTAKNRLVIQAIPVKENS